MAQIDKVRLPDGTTVRPTDWSSTPVWSSVEIASGNIQTLSAFSYGLGGAVPGSVGARKSQLCDTNWKGDGGVVQESDELLIYSVMVEFFMKVASLANFFNGNADAPPDPPLVGAESMLRLQCSTLLVMAIANTKDYLQHPVGFFPQAMGVQDAPQGQPTNNNAGGFLTGANGGVNSYENRKLATPHRAGPGEAFAIDLEFPRGAVNDTAGNGLDFGADASARILARIYVDGYRRRPVA